MSDGALQPVLSLCGMKEHIALLAVMTLSLIVEHQANLAALVEVNRFTFFFSFCCALLRGLEP